MLHVLVQGHFLVPSRQCQFQPPATWSCVVRNTNLGANTTSSLLSPYPPSLVVFLGTFIKDVLDNRVQKWSTTIYGYHAWQILCERMYVIWAWRSVCSCVCVCVCVFTFPQIFLSRVPALNPSNAVSGNVPRATSLSSNSSTNSVIWKCNTRVYTVAATQNNLPRSKQMHKYL